jgi:hypothetical protein
MEWRPQKEGIATFPALVWFFQIVATLDGMETSKRRDCDKGFQMTYLTSKIVRGWNGDLKKKGLRPLIFLNNLKLVQNP